MKTSIVSAIIAFQLIACAGNESTDLSTKALDDEESELVDHTSIDQDLSLSQKQCTPSFGSYAGGNFGNWMGADAAYSVWLKNGKTLWFFGDTFMKFGAMDRRNAAMIANTIAVSSCDAGKFKVTYNWRLSKSIKFEPFFKHAIKGRRYWPAKPWMVDDRLFVPLLDVQAVTTGFGFRIVGVDVAIVDNPEALPHLWQINIRRLTTHDDINMGQGVFANKNYVYLINGVQGGTTLARIAIADLQQDPFKIAEYMQYYDVSGKWLSGYSPEQAKNIGLHAGSGLTVRWDASLRLFLALYADYSVPGQLAKQVSVSTAPTLRGPWTKPTPVFKFPESDPSSKQFVKGTYCYAAYEHPQFNSSLASEFAFTYNCNNSLDTVTKNLNLYFPQFVRTKIPLK
jgi:hypothetical protein